MIKKLILGLILACFSPDLIPKFFFKGLTSTWCYTFLQAIIVCNLKESQWSQSEKMIKNLVSGPILVQIFIALPKNLFGVLIKCYALLQAVIVCNFKETYKTKLEKIAKEPN